MSACPLRGLAVGPALHPELKRRVARQRGKDTGGDSRIVTRGDQIANSERVGLIFLLARKAQYVETRACQQDVVDARTKDRADDRPEDAERVALGILLADMGVVCRDVSNFVPE